MSKKNNKQPLHVTYNKKVFVAPNSINSMSAIHTKILSDGIAVVRISDCHGSIKWWNDLNKKEEVSEMLVKIDTALAILTEMRGQVAAKSTLYYSNDL